jgi:septum formation topological specificity factor MinE
MDKEFSADFQKDILDLAEKCFKEQTDNITVSFDYGNCILDVDITFRVHIKDEEENESLD